MNLHLLSNSKKSFELSEKNKIPLTIQREIRRKKNRERIVVATIIELAAFIVFILIFWLTNVIPMEALVKATLVTLLFQGLMLLNYITQR